MLIKIHFLRLNPTNICELAVPDTMTIAGLSDTLAILYSLGSTAGKIAAVISSAGEVTGELPAHEGIKRSREQGTGAGKDQLISDLIKEGEIGIFVLDDNPEFSFGIEMISHTKEDVKYPVIRKVRGYELPRGVRTMKQLNSQLQWQKSTFQIEDKNRRLKKSFRTKTGGSGFSYSETLLYPITAILESYKKDDMKEICSEYLPFINTNQNKTPLAEDMADGYVSGGGFQRVLQKIAIPEYERIKQVFCAENVKGYVSDSQFPVLRSAGLIGELNGGRIRVADRFMEYLENYFETVSEEEFLEEKMFRAVLEYGAEVYSFLPKRIAMFLFGKYYGKERAERVFRKYWGRDMEKTDGKMFLYMKKRVPVSGNSKAAFSKRSVELDMYYNGFRFDQKTAEEFGSHFDAAAEIYWYTPEKTVFEKIVRDGVTFDQNEMKAFYAVFQRNYYVAERRLTELAYEVCLKIRLNWDKENIVSSVINQLYGGERVRNKLESFLDKVWDDTGRIRFLGNSPKVWDLMTR